MKMYRKLVTVLLSLLLLINAFPATSFAKEADKDISDNARIEDRGSSVLYIYKDEKKHQDYDNTSGLMQTGFNNYINDYL